MSKVYLNSKDKNIRYNNQPYSEKLELLFETERDLDVYDILKDGNKFYSVGSKEIKTDSVAVDMIDFKINPEPIYNDDFICPYCSYNDGDSFEYDEKGETFCSSCGSALRYERVECNFNIDPVFPTSIIII